MKRKRTQGKIETTNKVRKQKGESGESGQKK